MQGFVRLAGDTRDDNAVQWWYWWQEDDGWAFARGGRVRTTRAARLAIREATFEMRAERQAFLKRPTHKLVEGEPVPLERSPYEATTTHKRLQELGLA
jgi:hypothetical protein